MDAGVEDELYATAAAAAAAAAADELMDDVDNDVTSCRIIDVIH